jgi:flagellar hook protein FlgE
LQKDENGTYWRMTRSGSWIEWDEPVDEEPYYPQRRKPTVKSPDDAAELMRDARQIDDDFVRSVIGQFDNRGTLTLKQWDALRRTVERNRKANPEKFAKDKVDVLDGLPKAPDEILPIGKDGSAKIVILAHETDKGIPDVVGDNPEVHTTAITMPPTKLKVEYIGEDGTVSVELFAGGGAQQLGQIQTARFVNPAGLQPLGGNLYKETVASGAPQLLNPGTQAAGTLRQGMLEASNVNVVEEMVNMIETQRAYEINSKAISAADGMLRFLNNNL